MTLEDNDGLYSAYKETGETCLDAGECAIPLLPLSASLGQKGETQIEKKGGGECSEDCQFFHPADLLSFAWQIARGMVSKIIDSLSSNS